MEANHTGGKFDAHAGAGHPCRCAAPVRAGRAVHGRRHRLRASCAGAEPRFETGVARRMRPGPSACWSRWRGGAAGSRWRRRASFPRPPGLMFPALVHAGLVGLPGAEAIVEEMACANRRGSLRPPADCQYGHHGFRGRGLAAIKVPERLCWLAMADGATLPGACAGQIAEGISGARSRNGALIAGIAPDFSQLRTQKLIEWSSARLTAAPFLLALAPFKFPA